MLRSGIGALPLVVPAAALLLAAAALLPAAPAAAQTALYESPPVHPLELTPDGTRLLAVNTDDHRLSIFDLTAGPDPVLVAEVPVGLEPVTVRARTDGEAWVVNRLSDSVSILDLATGNVVRTLNVGDEPTDVVFAGSPSRAFVCVSQEDRLAVYDAASPATPPASVPLEGRFPRSLAVSPAGDRVYVGIRESGNRTTVVPEEVVDQTLGLPPPDPPMDPALPAAPAVGLIVRHDGAHWTDELGRSWDAEVPYTLLDHDVFAVDAASATVAAAYDGVGTEILNLAVNPATGGLVATNLEALNQIRFEPNLRGLFRRNRVTRIDPAGGAVVPVELNPHIDYADPAGSAGERALSLGLPLDVVVSPDGQTTYVAAYGSALVGVLDAAGTVTGRLAVGNGPCGLALDPGRGRLYVLNRFDDTVSSVPLAGGAPSVVVLGYDPTPPALREGRRLFYDTRNASAHGNLACASCHTFGGMDGLAWDLGDPTGSFRPAPPNQPGSSGFHPMKGPMTTQSLRGLGGTEPLHWRGDRADLATFNDAFVTLLGRSAPFSPGDFQLLQDFLFALRYPPNPNRRLDDSLPNPATGPSPFRGRSLFLTGNLVGTAQCVDCHALPSGENGLIIPANLLLDTQDMVVPQLRNMYRKTRFQASGSSVRGYGFIHDGTVPDLFTFLQFPRFSFRNDGERMDVAAFLLAFDSGTPSATGAQVTFTGTASVDDITRLNTLVAQADAGAIGLIAKGRDGAGALRGWKYRSPGDWLGDRASEAPLGTTALRNSGGPGTEVTFTGVPPGLETRLGVDRDEDGFFDRDERDAGSDPADPASTPANVAVGDGLAGAGAGERLLAPAVPNPAGAAGTRIAYRVEARGPVRLTVFDVQGRAVRTLAEDPAAEPGPHQTRWDLRDDAGARVGAGVYFVKLATAAGGAGQRILVLR